MPTGKLDTILLPTAYAPPIHWMALFLFHPDVKIEVWENFQRASVRNRCAIATSQGVQLLTVPLEGGRSQGAIGNVQISYAEDWPKQHAKALKTAYAKSPFYDFLEYDLHQVLFKKYATLLELNHAILLLLLDWMQCERTLVTTERFEGVSFVGQNKAIWSPTTHIAMHETYPQVFDETLPFVGNLSLLDLLFNKGPEALDYLDAYFLRCIFS